LQLIVIVSDIFIYIQKLHYRLACVVCKILGKGEKSQEVIALVTSYLFCNSNLLLSGYLLLENPKSQQQKQQHDYIYCLSVSKPIETDSSREILVYPSGLLENESIDKCFERLTAHSTSTIKPLLSKQSITNSDNNSDRDFDTKSDIIISCDSNSDPEDIPVLTMYKRVDKKVKPVPGTFPQTA
jgi:hypothetical protein